MTDISAGTEKLEARQRDQRLQTATELATRMAAAAQEIHRFLVVAASRRGLTIAEAQKIADVEVGDDFTVALIIANLVERALYNGMDLPWLLREMAGELEGELDQFRNPLEPDEVERALSRFALFLSQ